MSQSMSAARSPAVTGLTESSRGGPPKQKIRGSPPTSAAELAHLGTKCGYLRKEADNEKGLWSKYFFVVKPSTFLYYYKTEKDEYPRGVIDMEYMTDVRLNSQCIKRSVGGSNYSFRVAADVKTTEQKKIRPLFLDIDTDDREGGEAAAADARKWMQALQGHRYIQVDSQRDDLAVELKELKERLAASEATVAQLTDKLDHITRRAKYTVKEAMASTHSCRTAQEASFVSDSYESIAESLDALASLEKLGQVVGDVTTQVHARNQHIAKLHAELAEFGREKNLSPNFNDDTNDGLDELNPEILEAVLDDSQGAISSKQIRAMKQKSMRGFAAPTAPSTQMLGAAMSLGFSKAKAATTRLVQAKLQRNPTNITPTSRGGGRWTRVESKQAPGTFYYVNEATGEESWEMPLSGVTEDGGSDDDGGVEYGYGGGASNQSSSMVDDDGDEGNTTNSATSGDGTGGGGDFDKYKILWKKTMNKQTFARMNTYAFAKQKKDAAVNGDVKEIDRDVHSGKESAQFSVAAQVVALAFNADASVLLVASQDKQLAAYKVDTQAGHLQTSLVEAREVPRNATSMVTSRKTLADGTQQDAVLIAVNAGEVMAYPVPHVSSHEGKSLLAHTTSIVTDVAINTDNTLLLSADRDEKIRVSNFPTTALVQSYCLGHRQCVRKLATSVTTPSLFVSVGLDDTLKLWEMTTGELLDSASLTGVETSADETKQCGLAVCPLTNHVAVVRNNTKHVDFFTIEDKVLRHIRHEVPSEAQPTHVQFLADGRLAVAYKQAPFLELFEVGASSVKVVDIPNVHTFAELAEITVLGDANEEDGDSDDGELRKKKLKPTHWKAKLPGSRATTEGTTNDE
ncbi:hypothetical protein B5M09_012735 [Aphanomyces astaci]|uniref:tRNA (guanine-N(7)-)-methyltransferase non-catalytic subunit n=1 Tax=Aphanomyces astaci TaxID=112090 RepID=A0A425DM55_APHAT|nr:hypothetical protein B5M09_012735 [Aphanomyces astaci]